MNDLTPKVAEALRAGQKRRTAMHKKEADRLDHMDAHKVESPRRSVQHHYTESKVQPNMLAFLKKTVSNES